MTLLKNSREEAAEDSKTANKKKAAFKRNTESYLNYGFIEQVIHILKPSLYNIIGGHELFNKTMKPSKLLHYMEPNHPVLKDKPLEFFKSKKKKKKHEHEE